MWLNTDIGCSDAEASPNSDMSIMARQSKKFAKTCSIEKEAVATMFNGADVRAPSSARAVCATEPSSALAGDAK